MNPEELLLTALPYETVQYKKELTALDHVLQTTLPVYTPIQKWAVRLFGYSVSGIALLPEPPCTALARSLLADITNQTGQTLPASWSSDLAELENALINLGKTTFPTLAILPAKDTNPLLNFYLELRPSVFNRYLAARAHRFLALRSHQLVTQSLAPLISVLKRLSANAYLIEKISLAAYSGSEIQRAIVLEEVRAFFRQVPNKRGTNSYLSPDTVESYTAVVAHLLTPLDQTFETNHVPTKQSRQYHGPKLRFEVDSPGDAEELELANPVALKAFQAAASDDPDSVLIVALETADELPELVGLTPPEAYIRRRYLQNCMVLTRYLSLWQEATLPLPVIGLGYLALIQKSSRLLDLNYGELVPLTLYHLLVTTGQNIETLLATKIRTDGEVTMLYETATNCLTFNPQFYPGKIDASQAEMSRAYYPVTSARTVVLDDFARWLLRRLYSVMPPDQKATGYLFGKLSRTEARQYIIQVCNEFIETKMPGLPELSFARLRHTYLVQMMLREKLHPLIAHFSADLYRMEFRAPLYYAALGQSFITVRLQDAQTKYFTRIKSSLTHLAEAQYELPHFPKLAAVDSAEDKFTGTRFRPQLVVVQKLVRQLLKNLAELNPNIVGDETVYRRLYYNNLLHLTQFLTMITTGGRTIEIIELTPRHFDLTHRPVLVTFQAKGNVQFEEHRTLALTERVALLWQTLRPSIPDSVSVWQIYPNPQKAEVPARPVRRSDLENYLRRMAANIHYQNGTPLSEEFFKLHSCRHLLFSFSLEENLTPAAAAYLLGHQTTGLEHLHPLVSEDIAASWQSSIALADKLLDRLGVSREIILVIINQDWSGLATLLALRPYELAAPVVEKLPEIAPQVLSLAALPAAQTPVTPPIVELPLAALEKALALLADGAPYSLQKVILTFRDLASNYKLVVTKTNLLSGFPLGYAQLCFDKICQPTRGAELRPRQRSYYARLFNTKLIPAVQPYLADNLTPVRNYRRTARPLPVRADANLVMLPSEFESLLKVLVKDITTNTYVTPECWFWRLVLILIAEGVTFKGCFTAFCQLRKLDIGRGYLKIRLESSGRKWLRFWLSDLSDLILKVLLIHHGRSDKKVNKRTVKATPAQMYLASGTTHSLSSKQVARMRQGVNTYLAKLCAKAGVPKVTTENLLAVARWRLYEQKKLNGAVIATLAGQLATSVMPPDAVGNCHAALMAKWQVPVSLPSWQAVIPARRTRSLSKVTLDKTEVIHHEDEANEINLLTVKLNNGLSAINKVLGGLVGASAKKPVVIALQELARTWLQVQKTDNLAQALQEASHYGEALNFNLAAMALWLAELVQSQRPKTVLAYRSEAGAILRAFPDRRVSELGQEEVETLLEFDLTEQPKFKRRSALVKWRQFLGHLMIKLPGLNLKQYRAHLKTSEEALITPTELTLFMGTCLNHNTPLSRLAFQAAPFCYYGMLRISEVIRLKVGDVVALPDRLIIHVRPSKRGKKRTLQLPDLPDCVRKFMLDLVKTRISQIELARPEISSTELLNQPLLSGKDEKPVLLTALSNTFSRLLNQSGLVSTTAHTLRKSGASWRYLDGIDIRQITSWLGHKEPGVTFLSYIRVLDLKQRQAAQKQEFNIVFSGAKLGGLFAISERMGQIKAASLRTDKLELSLKTVLDALNKSLSE